MSKPYIINRIPIESWKVFHRDGMNVHITEGMQLKEKYSRSRQDHFVQLINDPIYNGGIQLGIISPLKGRLRYILKGNE